MESYKYKHHTINNHFMDFYRYKYKIYPEEKIFTKICSCAVEQSINLQHAGRKSHALKKNKDQEKKKQWKSSYARRV